MASPSAVKRLYGSGWKSMTKERPEGVLCFHCGYSRQRELWGIYEDCPFSAEQQLQHVPGEVCPVHLRYHRGTQHPSCMWKARRQESIAATIASSYAATRLTMYFAKKGKGHAEVKGAPLETFGGILIHDHESIFSNMAVTTRNA